MPAPSADPPACPDRATVRALVLFSFVAGAVDAVTFAALSQLFAAVMTGNLLLFGFCAAWPSPRPSPSPLQL